MPSAIFFEARVIEYHNVGALNASKGKCPAALSTTQARPHEKIVTFGITRLTKLLRLYALSFVVFIAATPNNSRSPADAL
jgi:hypothetical protein